MKARKKFLAGILTVLLCVACLSAAAFADGETVASYNGVEYTSWSVLADAMGATYNAASNTLTLQDDTEMSAAFLIYSDVTLDLGGNTLSRGDTGYSAILIYGGDVTVTNGTISTCSRGVQVTENSNSNVTVSNVTIEASYMGVGAWSGTVTITNSNITGSSFDGVYLQTADATVSNSTVTGATGIAVFGDGSEDATELTVSNSSVTGTESFGISTNGSYSLTGGDNYSNCSITVNDSAIEGEASGMYLPAVNSTTVINGDSTTITGTETGIEIRAGELTVNGGTITATATTVETNPNGSGTTSSGMAISVVQHTTKQDITVTINGGELVGEYALYEENTEDNPATDLEKISIIVNGGTFTTTNESEDAVAVYITDATADGDTPAVADGIIAISGGTYNTAVDTSYLDESVAAVVTSTGEDGETVSSYSYFTSVTEAMAAASTEDTVSLIAEEGGCAHSYVYSYTLREATCAKNGLQKWVCSECGTAIYVTVVVEHDYEITESTVTCTEDGKITYTCTVCGDTYTEEVEASEDYHQYDEAEAEIVEATCGEDGYIKFKCTVCGEEVTYVLAATGEHTWVEDFVVDATCTENTKVGTICSVCGAEGDDVVEIPDTALGHDYIEELVDATCDEDQHIEITCSRCDYEATETYDGAEAATGHDVACVHVDATCSKPGYTIETCSKCDYVKITEDADKTLNENNHVNKEVILTLREADCSTGTNGLVKYKCNDCNATWYEVVNYEHEWEITTTTATCQTAGDTTYTCAVCGAMKTTKDEMIDHDYQVTDHKDATCEDGYTTYTCTMCKESYTETIPATEEHTWVADSVVEATCEDNMKVGTICAVCGAEGDDVVEIAGTATGHDYTWVLEEANCTEGEHIVYTCSNCGNTYSEETWTTEALGHTWVEETVPATCSTTGYTKYVCSVCGVYDDYYEELSIDGDAHVEEEMILREATCSKSGVSKFTCTLCGQSEYRVTTVEHTYGEEQILGDTNIVYQVCEVCGDVNILLGADEITEDTHIFVEKITDATCTEDGEIVYTCALHDDCEENYTEIIEATGHAAAEAVVENMVESTCAVAGSYDEVVYCAVCGEELSRETVTLEALEHTAGETVVENVIEATATKDGSYDEVVYCTVCGEELSRETIVIPATGECDHENTSVVGAVDATCTEDGYTGDTVCDDCGAILATGEVIPATGHNYVDGVCTMCGAEDPDYVAPHEHVYTSAVTKEATCTEEGEITYTCECGDSYTEVIPATGHSYKLSYDAETDSYAWICEICGAARG
ncbi:MAG: right-handed parallel beta-helix repeat-containing protein [Oscillospiraceae bacterium]|nr:right-handed parallel beta-helix repeat-containing protein [Oscillospiraceae bacterium]